MKSFTFLLSIFLLVQQSSFTISQPDFLFSYCSDKGNYTENSIYRKNVESLLSFFSTNSENTDGFYNNSVGNHPDQVNGIGLCRGDVGKVDCSNCIKDSTAQILQICPNQVEAFGSYDTCMLRFSNVSIYGIYDRGFFFEKNRGFIPMYLFSGIDVKSSELGRFNRVLGSLISNLTSMVASGGSFKKFATGSNNVSGSSYTIYGQVQCTPDLSPQDCTTCLKDAESGIQLYNEGRRGGRVVGQSCNVRFDIYQFYENTSLPPAPSPAPMVVEQTPMIPGSPSSIGKNGNTRRTVVIIVVAVIMLVICICFFLRVHKSKRKFEAVIDDIEEVESLQFDFDFVRIVTNDFSEARKLGEGGFGSVYKGILPNGQEIAVKRLSRRSGQGELEFKNEVLLVAKLLHRNLIKLLGFCLEGEERLLVYEYVSNSSLDKFIYDPIKRAELNWPTRFKIIMGIARGLVYLHEDSRLRIVHRDLKASNILLDEEMNPKISDFGMARLFRVDQTQSDTSKIVGTLGYMAPEYIMRGRFSVKSDVFSFGVLILEILSGLKNTGSPIGDQEENLLSFAWRNYSEGTTLNVMDSSLVDGSRSDVMRCIHVGLLCVQESESNRPTMTEIITMLSSNSITLQIPSKPAFFIHTQQFRTPTLSHSRATELDASKSEDRSRSRNEVSITELEPR